MQISSTNKNIIQFSKQIIAIEKKLKNNIDTQHKKIFQILDNEKAFYKNLKKFNLMLKNNEKILKQDAPEILKLLNDQQKEMALILKDQNKLMNEYKGSIKKSFAPNTSHHTNYKTTDLYYFFGVENGNVILVNNEGKYFIAKINSTLKNIGLVTSISQDHVVAGNYIIKKTSI